MCVWKVQSLVHHYDLQLHCEAHENPASNSGDKFTQTQSTKFSNNFKHPGVQLNPPLRNGRNMADV